MNPSTVAERVAKGAALLDKKSPGWREKIDLKRLKIDSCFRCVVGQAFGVDEILSFGDALRDLGLTWKSSEDYGFDQREDLDFESLQAAWVEELTKEKNR